MPTVPRETYDSTGKVIATDTITVDAAVANADTLRAALIAALPVNKAFADAAKPATAAGQASAAYDASVRGARQMNRLILYVLGRLDDISDGT